MSRIITIPFTEDFIEHLADYLYLGTDAFSGSQKGFTAKQGQSPLDLRKVAVVFGGHRPSLFLKRAMARRIKSVFYPPQFLTIDDFTKQIVQSQQVLQPLANLDHCYLIYQLAQKHTPVLLRNRERFAAFLPWAQEILGVIEQLDLELTSESVLKNLQAQAQIGFDVPEDLEQLLENLFVLRRVYHEALQQKGILTRGHQYQLAANLVSSFDLGQWQEIVFCNFFYLHRSEMKIIEHCYKNANTTMFMQGDQRRWPALKRISAMLGQEILEGPEVIEGSFKLQLHAAFDMHSQAAMVKDILEKISDYENTVIVLPQADFILPFLSILSSQIKEFNISLGYPLKRSSLFALLERIFAAQRSLQEEKFYTRDYLRLLHHPLVKNLNVSDKPIIQALIHNIEQLLTGQVSCDFSGQSFIDLDLFAKEEKIYEILDSTISKDELRQTLKFVHDLLLKRWQKAKTFKDLALTLSEFTLKLQQQENLLQYPFNERIAIDMERLAQELSSSIFASQTFLPSEMFRILEDTLSRQVVAFSGSPLRGLQVLGLFETRSLSFDNVIVVDANEGVLPNLNIYEPLIPRDIMIKLNLDRLELEEEIQRYGFMRLISSARHVHLVYQERADKERSRFIEELIWQEEKKEGTLGVVAVERGRFALQLSSNFKSIPKTPAMIEMLKAMSYSASSLNTYLRNPYEFYENYVLGLREMDNLLDEPEARHIGTFVHSILEDGFRPWINRKPVLDGEFKKHFFNLMQQRFDEHFSRRGSSEIFFMKTVLETRFERFLETESKRCETQVQSIIALERRFEEFIELNGKHIRLVYRMDRIDRLEDGSIWVIDYKTGGMELVPKDYGALLESPLSRELIRDELMSFQMPLYLYYLQKQYPAMSVNACLYHLRTNTLEKFVKTYDTQSTHRIVDAGLRSLDFVVGEILNPEIPFVDDPVEIR